MVSLPKLSFHKQCRITRKARGISLTYWAGVGHLFLIFRYVPDFAKPSKLLELLPGIDGRVLVFTQTKKSADNLEKFLNNQNLKVMAIHGDKNQRDRE